MTNPGLAKIGWIGTGRMGFALSTRLLEAGYDLAVYNRTRPKAEPLAALGATVVDRPADLADRDVVFIMVSAPKDLQEVVDGRRRLAHRRGRLAGSHHRLLDGVDRGVREDPRARGRARQQVPRLPRERQPRSDRGGQAHPCRVRSARNLRIGEGLAQHARPRCDVGRRRGGGAARQDRAQRLPRDRHSGDGRDHRPRREGRRQP